MLLRDLRGPPEPHDPGDVLRPGPEPALLFAAVDERGYADPLLHVERSDALRAVYLVPGEGQEVHVEVDRIHRHLPDRLGRVGVEEGAVVVGYPHQFPDGLDRPGLVVRHHDGDEESLRADQALEIGRVDPAGAVHRQERDAKPELLKPPAGLDDRGVLGRGGDDLPSYPIPAGKGKALDHRVVRLGAGAGEGDPPGGAVEQAGKAPPGGLDGDLRVSPLPVYARGVARV